MPSIAILDDRKADRETIGRVVATTLKQLPESKDWSVVTDAPPSRERDVFQWLDENDATVLLTDWKLNEGGKGQRVVTYEADRLIREIRSRRPNFPIYVITGFETEARGHLKDVESILSRRDFARTAETVVPQMIRAGSRRHEEQRELLVKMDVLARRVAAGKASKKQLKDLQALQGYFQADIPTMINLDSALEELEAASLKADKLRKQVQRRLAGTKEKK